MTCRMPKTTTSLATPLREQLDRLAAFTPTPMPVLSLYLDLRSLDDETGLIDQLKQLTLPAQSSSAQ